MHEGCPSFRPRLLNERQPGDAVHLRQDAQLHESIYLVVSLECFELGPVPVGHFSDRVQPLIQDADRSAGQGGPHAPAEVVAADDDVLHLESVNGELEHAEYVRIVPPDEVSDVPVDEDLARFDPRNVLGGNTAVRASDPQKLRLLSFGERAKEARL